MTVVDRCHCHCSSPSVIASRSILSTVRCVYRFLKLLIIIIFLKSIVSYIIVLTNLCHFVNYYCKISANIPASGGGFLVKGNLY